MERWLDGTVCLGIVGLGSRYLLVRGKVMYFIVFLPTGSVLRLLRGGMGRGKHVTF